MLVSNRNRDPFRVHAFIQDRYDWLPFLKELEQRCQAFLVFAELALQEEIPSSTKMKVFPTPEVEQGLRALPNQSQQPR